MTLLEILREVMGSPPPPPPPPAGDPITDGPVHPLLSEQLPPEQLEALRARAEAGEADAQVELGLAHYRGLGVELDRVEAFKWFTLANDQGHAEGARLRKLVGPGLDDDQVHEARSRVARFRGEAEPLRWVLPERGDGVDFETGIGLDTGARPNVLVAPQPGVEEPAPVASGGALAWFWVTAVLLLVGVGAVISFMPVKEVEEVGEQVRTAKIEDEDSAPSATDEMLLSQGFGALMELAKGGNVRAQYLVGLSYAKGDGVDQSPDLAAFWYQQAAYSGDRDAQNNFGVMYVKGEVVAQDVIEAYKWFSLAAQQGSAGAGKNRDQLSLMLSGDQIAEGTKRAVLFNSRPSEGSLERSALQQLTERASAGDANAQYQMGMRHVEGGKEGNNFVEAMKWFRQAAMQGHPNAQNNLGVLISLGMGGETNLVESYKWIALAESGGCRDATKNKVEIGGRLSAAELAEALKLVAQFRPEAAPQQ